MIKKVKRIVKNLLPYAIHKRFFDERGIVLEDTHLGEPEIFNRAGERMRVFYLKDRLSGHLPYASITTNPKRILWDRYNYTLPIHFYGSQDISEIEGNPEKKFAWLMEAESIDGGSYERLLHDEDLAGSFNAIFTYSERVLNKYANAKFIPATQTWYGSIKEGGEWDPLRYEKKLKNISMICSNKAFCEWHLKRNSIAEKYMNGSAVDVFGSFTGTFLQKKAEALDTYRYSIVVENAVSPYYFTEKLLDCFGAMTVPIYIGASNIGEFFNSDGIIKVNPNEYDDLDQIIKACTIPDYESRKEAIIENYTRVQYYRNLEEYFMDNYSTLF